VAEEDDDEIGGNGLDVNVNVNVNVNAAGLPLSIGNRETIGGSLRPRSPVTTHHSPHHSSTAQHSTHTYVSYIDFGATKATSIN